MQMLWSSNTLSLNIQKNATYLNSTQNHIFPKLSVALTNDTFCIDGTNKVIKETFSYIPIIKDITLGSRSLEAPSTAIP